ncbi:MAG: Fic family protein [archaeon]
MRIVKKKKGKKEYFYLRYSFRKKGRVVTREKYLGSEIPSNIEEMKAVLLRESKKELNDKLERIKKNFQEEWKRLPASAKKREMEEIAIAFTYNTNAIEGSTITLEEVREIVKEDISPNKPLRDVGETESHNKVFLKMFNNKEKISKSAMLMWHKNIFGGTKEDIAGNYRDYSVRVENYVALDWQDIDKTMQKLVRYISSAKINSVELSARAHYRFEKIHPFGDGNGRIGRLLMNHVLWWAGYPMLIIEYKKRKPYYKALKKDEEGFVNYFIRRYLAFHGGRAK